MTSRERVLAALQHKEPDRVPVDLGATESTGIMAVAYNHLKAKLGLAGHTQVFDLAQMIAKVELPVMRRLGVDAVALLIEPKKWRPWVMPDRSHAEIPDHAQLKRLPSGETVLLAEHGTVIARCPPDGFYMDQVYHPLEQAATEADIDAGARHFKSFDWPSYLDEDFHDLRVKAQRLRSQSQCAIVANLMVHLFAAGQSHRGFANFMTDLVANKALAHRLLQRQVEAYLPRVDQYVAAIGEYVDIILVNDDLGGQAGPLLSLPLYREMIKPYHQQLWSHIKKKSGKPLMLHSCGSIHQFIPDLIELGVNAVNPVQVSAANMDSAKLKREFGRDITFWGGGCDTQQVLARGTPQQVRDEVRRRVNDFAPGGGFVFSQVHNIQANVPVENILAMYEELGTLTHT